MNWIKSSGDKSISNATTDNAQKSKTAGPFLFAVIGVLLNLTGLIVPLCFGIYYGNGLQFLTFLYYIGVLIGFSRHVKKSTFDQNRMTMMAFLAIGFVYLSFDIQLSIFLILAGISRDSEIATAGSATSLAGCLITIISWTYLMIRTGEIPSMQSLPN